MRAVLEELLGGEVREDPLYPALYGQEYSVDLEGTLTALGMKMTEVGTLPKTLRWTRANRLQGLTPGGATTLGDVLEGMGEHLCSRWFELATRSLRDGLPSFESLSNDLQLLVGPAEFLRLAVGDEPYWSPGKKRK